MSSASEAETGTIYYGNKHAIPYRVTLQEMGHLQSKPTPVTTDNNTAYGLTMSTMTLKASTSNNMRFQWFKFHKAQQLFAFVWARGTNNCADYPIKHYYEPHHLHVRPNYVVDQIQPTQWTEIPQICLYKYQVMLYMAECVTFFTFFN